MYCIDKNFLGRLAQFKKNRRPNELKSFNINTLEGRNLDEVVDKNPGISLILERIFCAIAKEIPALGEERIKSLRAKHDQRGHKEDHNTATYLSHLLFTCHHFDEAMITYESILQSKKDDIEVLTRYAISCLKTDNFPGAQRVLLQILSFDPAPLEQNEDIKNELCLLAHELMNQDMKKAEEFYEFVYGIDERFVPAMIGLGDIKKELHLIDDAKFFYKMADAHQENSLGANLGLAHCYQLSGNRNKSLRYLKECEAMSPTDTEVWIEIAVIYQELEAFTEAQRAIRTALIYDPTNDAALIRREQLRTQTSAVSQSIAN